MTLTDSHFMMIHKVCEVNSTLQASIAAIYGQARSTTCDDSVATLLREDSHLVIVQIMTQPSASSGVDLTGVK